MLQDRNAPVAIGPLTAEGPFAVPAVQAAYPCDVCDIITHLALQRLPGMGINSNMSFAEILQGPAELFAQFLDRTHATLSWQVNDDEARIQNNSGLILLLQLAFTNANEDWNKALLTVRNLCTCDIADMVRACQHVGITAHNTNSLAED